MPALTCLVQSTVSTLSFTSFYLLGRPRADEGPHAGARIHRRDHPALANQRHGCSAVAQLERLRARRRQRVRVFPRPCPYRTPSSIVDKTNERQLKAGGRGGTVGCGGWWCNRHQLDYPYPPWPVPPRLCPAAILLTVVDVGCCLFAVSPIAHCCTTVDIPSVLLLRQCLSIIDPSSMLYSYSVCIVSRRKILLRTHFLSPIAMCHHCDIFPQKGHTQPLLF